MPDLKLELVLHKKGVESTFYDAELKYTTDRHGSVIGRFIKYPDQWRFETIARPQIMQQIHLELIQTKLMELNE